MTTELIPDLIPDEIQFAENPEPRCPCVLLIDVSNSMQGNKMEQLNNGIATFAQELKSDPTRLAADRGGYRYLRRQRGDGAGLRYRRPIRASASKGG